VVVAIQIQFVIKSKWSFGCGADTKILFLSRKPKSLVIEVVLYNAFFNSTMKEM
jgi:hypothetical protein